MPDQTTLTRLRAIESRLAAIEAFINDGNNAWSTEDNIIDLDGVNLTNHIKDTIRSNVYISTRSELEVADG